MRIKVVYPSVAFPSGKVKVQPAGTCGAYSWGYLLCPGDSSQGKRDTTRHSEPLPSCLPCLHRMSSLVFLVFHDNSQQVLYQERCVLDCQESTPESFPTIFCILAN